MKYIIEIPNGVNQTELWQLETDLRAIAGVERVNLDEPKDLIQAAQLLVEIAGQAAGYVGAGIGVALSIQTAAKKLHAFLHPNPNPNPSQPLNPKDQAARREAELKLADGSSVKLYNYSPEELARLLAEHN